MLSERVVTVEQTGSTNADLKALAEVGWPEGRWLRALCQTAGRGRLGRDWLSEPGNLFASTLVELRPGDPSPTDIAFLAGIAVHEALVGLAPQAPFRLKWPNDVMAGKAKLAGILLERVERGVVVGIGINVAAAPALEGRSTSALADLAGGDCPPVDALMVAIVGGFADWLGRWRAAGFDVVRRAWLLRGHQPGEALEVRLPDGALLNGHFVSLGSAGELIVGLDGGESRAIHAGDVGLL